MLEHGRQMIYARPNHLSSAAANTEHGSGGPRFLARTGLVLLAALLSFNVVAADLKEAQDQFITGNYSKSIALAHEALRDRPDSEEWSLLLSQALRETGRYPEAQTVVSNALSW